MKKAIATIFIAIAISASLPESSIETEPALSIGKGSYMVMADIAGTQMGIPPAMIKNIAKHESGYDNDVVGDHGLAHGVVQFHKATFDHYASLYLKSTGKTLQYASGDDQIVLMTWMWVNYPKTKHLWSTYNRIYGNKAS